MSAAEEDKNVEEVIHQGEDDDVDASVAEKLGGGEEDGESAEAVAVDAEIEEMKRKVQEMEEEAAKISEMQNQVERQMGAALPVANGSNIDECSVHVGQVDYESTPEELQALFQSCGTINRITILCDKFTGKPKGFAYIEFADKESAENAVLLNDTLFRGRKLKVTPKRQNVPRFQLPRGRGRGGPSFRARGGRGRGRGGFRGRGGGRYHPYYG